MSEAQWHIQNATVDIRQFMTGVPEGQPVADAAVFRPGGAACTLSSLWRERPALIVTGSLTCPPSRRLNPATGEIADTFAGRLNVVLLYVVDAHPNGDCCPYTGTDWVTATNQEEGVLIRQPRDQDERNRRAAEYQALLGLTVEVVVDNMEDTGWAAVGRAPNTAVLVGTDGRCMHYQTWFRPEEFGTALERIFDRE